MELDSKGRIQSVPQTFYCTVVDFHVGDQQSIWINAVRINRIAVVLTGKINSAGGNFTNRMIETAVAILHFKSVGAIGECE